MSCKKKKTNPNIYTFLHSTDRKQKGVKWMILKAETTPWSWNTTFAFSTSLSLENNLIVVHFLCMFKAISQKKEEKKASCSCSWRDTVVLVVTDIIWPKGSKLWLHRQLKDNKWSHPHSNITCLRLFVILICLSDFRNKSQTGAQILWIRA